MKTAARGGALLLLLLCLANALNIADRVLLGVVQEPIKHEFALSDFQLGLLGGPAFAVLYSILGLPIARLSERTNRSAVIAAALSLFSMMTAACGLATTYVQLLLARMGVSVGEAGVSPPALSLISDRYPASRRGVAMSLYAVGGPVGALLATIGAGVLAQSHGWRATFLLFGLLGLVLAALIALLIRDSSQRAASGPRFGFSEALRFLISRRSAVHLCIASALTGSSGMFIIQYITSFFVRTHGLTLGRASAVLGVMSIFGMLGSFVGGYLADAASRRRPGSSPMVVAIAFVIASPCYVISFWTPHLALAIGLFFIAATCLNCYTGISYAAITSVVPSTMRATAIACYTLASNLLGYALGPPIFGKVSDVVAAHSMSTAGIDAQFCTANPSAAACLTSAGLGLRWALSLSCVPLLLAAISYWRSARWMGQELVEHD